MADEMKEFEVTVREVTITRYIVSGTDWESVEDLAQEGHETLRRLATADSEDSESYTVTVEEIE